MPNVASPGPYEMGSVIFFPDIVPPGAMTVVSLTSAPSGRSVTHKHAWIVRRLLR